MIFLIIPIVKIGLSKETKMITMLVRHGARYSVLPDVAEEKKGQITTNGLRMCYLLGTYIRDRYSEFFSKRFNFNENYVLASSFDRTRQSAQAFMLGLYDFGSLGEVIEVDEQFYQPEWKDFDIKVDFETPLPLGYQPVPIHSLTEEENSLFLSFMPKFCPKMADYINPEDSKNAEITHYLNTILKDLNEQGIDIKKIIGKKKFDSMRDAFELGDFIEANYYFGKLNINKELYRKIEIIKTFKSYHSFFRDPELAKFFFTELARMIYDGIKSAVDNVKAGKTSYKKFNILFGHDLNIYNLYTLIGLSNFDCLRSMLINSKFDKNCLVNPPYASSVMWELHQEGNQFLIDFYIDGQKYGFCHKDPEKPCLFEEFTVKMNAISLQGDIKVLRNKLCREQPSAWESVFTFIIIADVVAILGISFLIYRKITQ